MLDAITPSGPEPDSFHGMITRSPQMIELFALIERLASTDTNALIRGESGTGKELVARSIHHLSRRARGPFRAINCATLSGELASSELFGHARGAFTGAVERRAGVFELARGGTVFMDELAELELPSQAKLLRVLEDRTFYPVGATRELTTDARLLAATHRSLRDEVERGRFRADLMYRIRVVTLFLPSLIERQGDVDALSWHFIAHFNARMPRTIEAIDREAYEAMHHYPWPGNVRELRNAIEGAYILGQGPLLKLHELPPELRGESPRSCGAPRTERELERQRLLQALQQAQGQRQEAAAALGMSRTTLWRKLREHGITP